MDNRLIEIAQSIAKGKDPREAWLDLRSWSHMKGSSAERAAVFAFLEQHSMNPAAVPLFPAVLKEAASVSASLDDSERKALIELADHASATAKGGFTTMDPSKDRSFNMSIEGNRPRPALHFRPEESDAFPRLGAPGPLAPSKDIDRYIEARDMVYRANDRLSELPAPIEKPKREHKRKEIPMPSEELTSISMPMDRPVMRADKGSELVKSLIQKMKEQSAERKPAKKAMPASEEPEEKPKKAKKKAMPKKTAKKKAAKKMPRKKPAKKRTVKKKPPKKKTRGR